MSDSQLYTLRWRGREIGPFSVAEINRKLDDHEIGMGHEIFVDDKWSNLEQFFAARKAATPSPPSRNLSALPAQKPAGAGDGPVYGANPVPKDPAQSAVEPERRPQPAPAAAPSLPPEAGVPPPAIEAPAPAKSTRRRLVYALLGILLGFSGAHNYYARHWLTGLLQLFLSIATFLLGFGIIVPWIWALAEVMLVRRDGADLEMI